MSGEAETLDRPSLKQSSIDKATHSVSGGKQLVEVPPDVVRKQYWPIPWEVENANKRPDGPVMTPETMGKMKATELPLPPGFEWSVVDVRQEDQAHELEELLRNHYVEDANARSVIYYSAALLKWALTPPGYDPNWWLGVRLSSNKKLVAFHSAVPVNLRVRGNEFRSAQANFLCVHTKLREKRVANVLIGENNRRIGSTGINQGISTSGRQLPEPLTRCRYYHRLLNVPRTIATGFFTLPTGQTIANIDQTLELPKTPQLPGFRAMTRQDVPGVTALLSKYQSRFDLAPRYSEEDVEHHLMGGSATETVGLERLDQGRAVWAFVVEDPQSGRITDIVSFYSSMLKYRHLEPPHDRLECAYLYYSATDKGIQGASSATASRTDDSPLHKRIEALTRDAMIAAKGIGFDVFIALTAMDNRLGFSEQNKFIPGSGGVYYYLFNWRTSPITGAYEGTDTSKIGLIIP